MAHGIQYPWDCFPTPAIGAETPAGFAFQFSLFSHEQHLLHGGYHVTVVGRGANLMDITGLRQSAVAHQECEFKFRILADHTYDWEYWINPDGEYIASMLKMIRRLIGEGVNLSWLPGRRLWPVKKVKTKIPQSRGETILVVEDKKNLAPTFKVINVPRYREIVYRGNMNSVWNHYANTNLA